MADLSQVNKFRKSANCFFDGSLGIDAVLVIEIDILHSQPLQAGVASGAYIFGLAIHAADMGIFWIAHNPELRGQHNLVALPFDGKPDQFFVGVGPYTSAVSRKLIPSSRAR